MLLWFLLGIFTLQTFSTETVINLFFFFAKARQLRISLDRVPNNFLLLTSLAGAILLRLLAPVLFCTDCSQHGPYIAPTFRKYSPLHPSYLFCNKFLFSPKNLSLQTFKNTHFITTCVPVTCVAFRHIDHGREVSVPIKRVFLF